MNQNPSFDLDALLVFGKVVESRSLSKAASLLGMPKSTVSRKLTKLESDLGIKLLRRNTHQLTVTDLGEKVYAHAATILNEANGVRALAEGSRQEPQGELRVAIPVFLGTDYASRVGYSFLSRYPHSRLDIRLVDSMVDPIRDGFDVVFGTGPLQDSTLIARKVFDLKLFLCASREFAEQLTEPLTAADAVERSAVHRLRILRPTQDGRRQRRRPRRTVAASPGTRQQLSGVQAVHPSGPRHGSHAHPDHLHRGAARRLHRADTSRLDARTPGSPHDLPASSCRSRHSSARSTRRRARSSSRTSLAPDVWSSATRWSASPS